MYVERRRRADHRSRGPGIKATTAISHDVVQFPPTYTRSQPTNESYNESLLSLNKTKTASSNTAHFENRGIERFRRWIPCRVVLRKKKEANPTGHTCKPSATHEAKREAAVSNVSVARERASLHTDARNYPQTRASRKHDLTRIIKRCKMIQRS